MPQPIPHSSTSNLMIQHRRNAFKAPCRCWGHERGLPLHWWCNRQDENHGPAWPRMRGREGGCVFPFMVRNYGKLTGRGYWRRSHMSTKNHAAIIPENKPCAGETPVDMATPQKTLPACRNSILQLSMRDLLHGLCIPGLHQEPGDASHACLLRNINPIP